MDHCRHILPSNYQHLSLEDSSELLLQPRQPLSNAAGNAQLRTLASVHLYRDGKGHRLQTDRPMYSIPTVPSQPPRQLLQGTLEQRRQNTRRRRHHRYTRNPIVDSPQYQAYRARQGRDGNQEDAKWPEILEIAFLDGNYLPRLASSPGLLTINKPLSKYPRWAEESSPTKANPTAVMSLLKNTSGLPICKVLLQDSVLIHLWHEIGSRSLATYKY